MNGSGSGNSRNLPEALPITLPVLWPDVTQNSLAILENLIKSVAQRKEKKRVDHHEISITARTILRNTGQSTVNVIGTLLAEFREFPDPEPFIQIQFAEVGIMGQNIGKIFKNYVPDLNYHRSGIIQLYRFGKKGALPMNHKVIIITNRIKKIVMPELIAAVVKFIVQRIIYGSENTAMMAAQKIG